MGKNVAVFVDVANIFYAAKAAGVDIDYVTLLKAATAGRDLVRAYAYTGLDPDNENQRNFHDFLRRHGYKVVSKDIRKYGDGKVKANLDIELVVDMMKTARNLDIAIVISGDGDFAPAIRAVQEMGVRCEVISFRGNTSSDLIEVADQFTEIAQIARVEKGSSRSGRRVADDDDDLSMTEVPDKQSEGTGTRGRGRGRSRVAPVEAEPVAAAPVRRRLRTAAPAAGAVAAVTSNGSPLVVLPGEKLSRVATIAAPVIQRTDEEIEADEAEDAAAAALDDALEDARLAGEIGPEGGDDAPRRRRRRRGGRGRGRGRDGADGTKDGAFAAPGELGDLVAAVETADLEDEQPVIRPRPVRAPAPPKRAAQTFGSVWDSQIGVPVATSGTGVPVDEDDLDEPPIPEYLIAERRGADRGRGPAIGGRGVRPGYAAAMDRERYGAGRSAGPSRFAEPTPRGVGGGGGSGASGRDVPRFRDDRPAPRPAPRGGSSSEPWSEVPPEIEAMLRAQLGGRPPRPARSAAGPSVPAVVDEAAAPKRRVTRRPAASATDPAASPSERIAPIPADDAVPPVPKRRTTRKATVGEAPTSAPTAESVVAEAAAPVPKRRASRAAAPVAGTDAVSDAPAIRKRAPRKAAGTADA